MKTFKQFMEQIPTGIAPIDMMRMLNRAKITKQDKDEIARKSAKQTSDIMKKNYELPTKVV